MRRKYLSMIASLSRSEQGELGVKVIIMVGVRGLLRGCLAFNF